MRSPALYMCNMLLAAHFCHDGRSVLSTARHQLFWAFVIYTMYLKILWSAFLLQPRVFQNLPPPQALYTPTYLIQLSSLKWITCPYQKSLFSCTQHLIPLISRFFSQYTCAFSFIHTDVTHPVEYSSFASF